MAEKTEAYIDTSALIAFLDRSDSAHPRFRRLFSDPPPMVTSALVIAEGHGWFLRRYDRSRSLQFLAFVEALPHILVRPFDKRELGKSANILRKFDDQNLTLADAHGLSIMAERRLDTCWSTDWHLTLTGARLVS